MEEDDDDLADILGRYSLYNDAITPVLFGYAIIALKNGQICGCYRYTLVSLKSIC